MIQVITANTNRERSRGNAARTHNELIHIGADRRVEGEVDAFVRNISHAGGSPVCRPAIEDEPARILKADDGKVLVALRIVTIGGRVGWSVQLPARYGEDAIVVRDPF